jgi:septum formation protein
VDRVTPLDMFPQTGHIEAVARLSLRDPILPPAGRGLPAVILASASPRRRELLPVLVPEFTVAPADIPEPLGTDPVADAIALAEAKARAVAAEYPGAAVIAADTVVHDGVRHFGKPASEADARAMLRDLAGREHRVVTGVAVATGAEVRSDFCEATVTMRARDDAAINAYVSSGIPLDKAGAYGIQDDPQRLVERLDGCYCTVVGLPLWSVRRLLHAAGVTDVGDPGAALRRCAECPDRLRGAVG